MSSSYVPSLSSGSLRRSLIRKITPGGFHFASEKSDSNSTTTGIIGPGRTVGSLLSRAGRGIERAVDRFAEKQLRLGPNAAVVRLVFALHQIHVNENPDCRSDHDTSLNAPFHLTDRLIWVCNGYCSQCYTAYLPHALTELPELALKALLQLMTYLRPSQLAANIGLASLYVRLIAQSRVLAPPLFQQLELLSIMETTYQSLLALFKAQRCSMDDLVSLSSAIAAVQYITDSRQTTFDLLMRSSFARVEDSEEAIRVLSEQCSHLPDIEDWALKEITFAQILTKLSATAWNLITSESSAVERLLECISQTQLCQQVPSYLAAHAIETSLRTAAAVASTLALVLQGHTRGVKSVAWSPDSLKIISGSEDTTICAWDARIGSQMATFRNDQRANSSNDSARVNSVAFSANGAMIAFGSNDGTVHIWDAQTGKPSVVFEAHNARVSSVVFSPDSRQIASGSWDNTVRIWDVKTGLESVALIGHTQRIKATAFSPNGVYLASASDDKSVRLWHLSTGRQVALFTGHSDFVWSVAFSSDNLHVASGSLDSTVRIWDTEAGREIRKLEGHTKLVTSVAFAPDGTRIASGSDDKTVRLWDARTGDPIAVLRGHSNWVSSVAFAPDGNFVASGSWDTTIRVWDVRIVLNTHRGSLLEAATTSKDRVHLTLFPEHEGSETESDSDGAESFETAASTPITDFE